MDGIVNFYADLKEHDLNQLEIDQTCYDLNICKKDMIKRMMGFKDRVGINRDRALVVDFLKQQMRVRTG